MPNIITDRQINKGYFFVSDEGVTYERIEVPYLKVPDNLLFEYGTLNDHHFYRLLDFETEDTIALMKLIPEKVHTHDYLTVKKVNSRIKGKGYGTFLYKAAILDNSIPILSDQTQTLPGSVNVWQNLHSDWQSKRKEISILNSRNGHVTPFSTNIPEYEIWGYDEEIISIISEDDDILQSMLDYEEISDELFYFIKENAENISDKKHIRLIGEST